MRGEERKRNCEKKVFVTAQAKIYPHVRIVRDKENEKGNNG